MEVDQQGRKFLVGVMPPCQPEAREWCPQRWSTKKKVLDTSGAPLSTYEGCKTEMNKKNALHEYLRDLYWCLWDFFLLRSAYMYVFHLCDVECMYMCVVGLYDIMDE